jgi:hypothetical protein
MLQLAASCAWNSTCTAVFDNVDVDPVPIPAAVWLFGSGLMGLFGLSRKRRKNQV